MKSNQKIHKKFIIIDLDKTLIVWNTGKVFGGNEHEKIQADKFPIKKLRKKLLLFNHLS